MTGPPNKVNPRGIRLQVLKENLELGIKFWADWGMEKELCFGCCFSLLHPERHFQTMWITTCFYQSSWDLWNGHFSFSFFFLSLTKPSIWIQREFPAGKPPNRTYTTQVEGSCAPVFCHFYTMDAGFPLCVPQSPCHPTSYPLHPPSGYHRNARNLYPKIMQLGWFLDSKIRKCDFPELGTFSFFSW